MAIGLQSRRRTMFDVCVSILALVVVARAIVDSFAPRDPRFGSVASGLVLCAVALPLTAILCRHAVQLVNLATTSATSTPPPAKSSAPSPSTAKAATTAPDDHQAAPKDPAKQTEPDPDAGPVCPRCLATSHGGTGGIRRVGSRGARRAWSR